MLKGMIGFHHLDHEGGFPAQDIIARTDAGEDLVKDQMCIRDSSRPEH